MPLSDQVVSPNLDIVADIEREMVALLALRRAIKRELGTLTMGRGAHGTRSAAVLASVERYVTRSRKEFWSTHLPGLQRI